MAARILVSTLSTVLLGAIAASCSGGGSSGGGGGAPPPPPPPGGSSLIGASRTTGVAPLAVFFDTDQVTSSTFDTFHEIDYSWDFGGVPGTFALTGNVRNTATGPVAATLYDSPGTFTVRLTFTEPGGTPQTETIAITVEDPNTTFSGLSTICFSTAGDFTGAPAGAQLITTSDFNDVQGQVSTGRRLLFRAGETWTTTGSNPLQINVPGPGVLGSFGPGANPRFELSGNGTIIELSGSSPQLTDWRIVDIDFNGNGNGIGIELSGQADQVTVLRCKLNDFDIGLLASVNILDFHNNNGNPGHDFHDQLAIVDSEAQRASGGAGSYCSFLNSERFMFLGNLYQDSSQGEHVLRAQFLDKGVISNCDMGTAAPNDSVLKFHARAFGGSGLGGGRFSEEVVMSDNIFRGGDEARIVIPGPQSASQDERLRLLLFERNLFIAGAGTQALLVIHADDVTVRNNVFITTGGVADNAMLISRRGAEPAHQDFFIYNNTVFSGDADEPRVLQIGSGVDVIELTNNFGTAPSSAVVPELFTGSATSFVETNNVVTNAPDFISASPINLVDFQLQPSSPALDAGAAVDGLFHDAIRTTRPRGADVDAGAFER